VKNKIIRLTESELKQIIEHQVYSNVWKKDFYGYIKRLKGLIDGINKSFDSMDDISFDDEIKENFIEDLKNVGKMVKISVDKLEK